jgi:hypothetical protein
MTLRRFNEVGDMRLSDHRPMTVDIERTARQATVSRDVQ